MKVKKILKGISIIIGICLLGALVEIPAFAWMVTLVIGYLAFNHK